MSFEILCRCFALITSVFSFRYADERYVLQHVFYLVFTYYFFKIVKYLALLICVQCSQTPSSSISMNTYFMIIAHIYVFYVPHTKYDAKVFQTSTFQTFYLFIYFCGSLCNLWDEWLVPVRSFELGVGYSLAEHSWPWFCSSTEAQKKSPRETKRAVCSLYAFPPTVMHHKLVTAQTTCSAPGELEHCNKVNTVSPRLFIIVMS